MDKIDYMYVGALMSVIFLAIATGIAVLNIDKNNPSAIDTYRGKTTLKIIYKDDIAIDSVVVYK